MDEIKIELNEEETTVLKKWRMFSRLSLVSTIFYFIFVAININQILENYEALILPVILLFNALSFHFIAENHKGTFLELINENHKSEKKKHKMIELLEKQKAEKEENEND